MTGFPNPKTVAAVVVVGTLVAAYAIHSERRASAQDAELHEARLEIGHALSKRDTVVDTLRIVVEHAKNVVRHSDSVSLSVRATTDSSSAVLLNARESTEYWADSMFHVVSERLSLQIDATKALQLENDTLRATVVRLTAEIPKILQADSIVFADYRRQVELLERAAAKPSRLARAAQVCKNITIGIIIDRVCRR
jgi:hypothetical protein